MPKLSQYKSRVKGKGWRPDIPSGKDWKLAEHHPGLSLHNLQSLDDLPNESRDRRADGVNGPVRDQGNAGSCVGFAATYGVDYLRRVDQDKLSTIYSPLQVYFDARVADGAEYAKVDSGAYIRDAVDQLRLLGIAPESAWPYKLAPQTGVPRKLFVQPSPAVYRKAKAWKLGAHWRCSTLEEILHAIDAGLAVIGGISCYSSMFTRAVDQSGMIPMPNLRTDAFEGGHALYWDRYVISDRLVRCENSWDGWGDGGYGYIPFEYLASRDLSDDFWALEKEAPETTPWKD